MPPRALSINVVACSTGAEAYVVASELMAKFPKLDFHVYASDLHLGFVSAVHSDEDVDQIIAGYKASLLDMRKDGLLE